MYKIIIILLFLFPSLLKAQFNNNDSNYLDIYFNSINLNDYNYKIKFIDSLFDKLSQNDLYKYKRFFNINIKDSLSYNQITKKFEEDNHKFIKKKNIINSILYYNFHIPSKSSTLTSYFYINLIEFNNDPTIIINIDNELKDIYYLNYNIKSKRLNIYKNKIIHKIKYNANLNDLIYHINKHSIQKKQGWLLIILVFIY